MKGGISITQTKTESELREQLDATAFANKQMLEEIKRLNAWIEVLERLDREAATHVESLICLRSKRFTGEPPYVGWKGLGLALSQDYDELDRARAALEPTNA